MNTNKGKKYKKKRKEAEGEVTDMRKEGFKMAAIRRFE
jgi:phage gp16-like protein